MPHSNGSQNVSSAIKIFWRLWQATHPYISLNPAQDNPDDKKNSCRCLPEARWRCVPTDHTRKSSIPCEKNYSQIEKGSLVQAWGITTAQGTIHLHYYCPRYHTFAYSFNEFVSVGIVIVHSWWKAGCPQGADQFSTDLCRGHGCEVAPKVLLLCPRLGIVCLVDSRGYAIWSFDSWSV